MNRRSVLLAGLAGLSAIAFTPPRRAAATEAASGFDTVRSGSAVRLWRKVREVEPEERIKIGQEIIRRHVDLVLSIGLISGVSSIRPRSDRPPTRYQ